MFCWIKSALQDVDLEAEVLYSFKRWILTCVEF